MMDVFQALRARSAAGVVVLGLATAALGQSDQHGRKFKPLPPTSHVVVTVEKGFNGKPLENAAVIFHAVRDGKTDANLEVKTDPDGKASIDLLEVGAHVTVQVLASGFASYAEDFDVTAEPKELLVKMQRPRAQISTYTTDDAKPAALKPGVQEHVLPKPAAGATGSTGSTGPIK